MIEELSFMLKANPFVPFTIRTSDESFEIQRSTVTRLSQNSLFLEVGTQTLILPFSSMQLVSVHGTIHGEPPTSSDWTGVSRLKNSAVGGAPPVQGATI
jgi:hypothetical protein